MQEPAGTGFVWLGYTCMRRGLQSPAEVNLTTGVAKRRRAKPDGDFVLGALQILALNLATSAARKDHERAEY